MSNFIALGKREYFLIDIEELETKYTLYLKLKDIVIPYGVIEESLKLWLYFSYLEAENVPEGEIIYFYSDNVDKMTKTDILSGFDTDLLRELKTVINNHLSGTLTLDLEVIIDDNVLLDSLKGENALYLYYLMKMRPQATLVNLLYYNYLDERTNVKGHLFATPTNHFFKTYGLHGNELDILAYKNAVKHFQSYEQLEVNISHLGKYQSDVVKYLVKSLPKVTLFILHSSDINIQGLYSITTPYGSPKLNLTIVGKKSLTDDQIKVLNIILGYRDSLPPITLPILSQYEKAVVIARRAKNIKNGSAIAISVPYDQIDLIEIAEQEILQKKLPGVKVVRLLPDGTQEEYNPNELLW